MPRRQIPRTFIIAAVVAIFVAVASVSADVIHSIPRSQLKKRIPLTNLTTHAIFNPTFDWEQEEYLNAHNAFRRKLGVPALSWSGHLTAAAHSWAGQRRDDCDYRRHSPNSYGENIFWMSYKEFSPSDVVAFWFDETRLYDHRANTCRCKPERKGCECGHYLNVVWSTTRRIGCSGAVYCDDQKGVYVVCNYDPPGLTPGINPFTGDKIQLRV